MITFVEIQTLKIIVASIKQAESISNEQNLYSHVRSVRRGDHGCLFEG